MKKSQLIIHEWIVTCSTPVDWRDCYLEFWIWAGDKDHILKKKRHQTNWIFIDSSHENHTRTSCGKGQFKNSSNNREEHFRCNEKNAWIEDFIKATNLKLKSSISSWWKNQNRNHLEQWTRSLYWSKNRLSPANEISIWPVSLTSPRWAIYNRSIRRYAMGATATGRDTNCQATTPSFAERICLSSIRTWFLGNYTIECLKLMKLLTENTKIWQIRQK